MKRRLAVLLTLSLLPCGGLQAQQTATATFRVSATVVAVCDVVAADLNFGSYLASVSAPLDSISTMQVTCTPETTYEIGLNEGTSAGATVNQRKMTSQGAAALNYQLYRDASRSSIWGNTPGTDTVAGTGTGIAQEHSVHGQLPGSQIVPAGVYFDTITVRVYY